MLLAASLPALLSPSDGTSALARLTPPLPAAWTGAASRLASPSEHLLLLQRAFQEIHLQLAEVSVIVRSNILRRSSSL